MIEIVIADDHHILTKGLEMLIDAQSDMKVIGIAESGEEAFEMARDDLSIVSVEEEEWGE